MLTLAIQSLSQQRRLQTETNGICWTSVLRRPRGSRSCRILRDLAPRRLTPSVKVAMLPAKRKGSPALCSRWLLDALYTSLVSTTSQSSSCATARGACARRPAGTALQSRRLLQALQLRAAAPAHRVLVSASRGPGPTPGGNSMQEVIAAPKLIW